MSVVLGTDAVRKLRAVHGAAVSGSACRAGGSSRCSVPSSISDGHRPTAPHAKSVGCVTARPGKVEGMQLLELQEDRQERLRQKGTRTSSSLCMPDTAPSSLS